MTSARLGPSADGHVSDEVLLALHDGERGTDVGVGGQHVERCVNCRARLAVIAARSDAVRASIAFIPIPPLDLEAFRGRVVAERARRKVSFWRRAAWQTAAAVTIATAAAAITVQRLMTSRIEPRQSDVPASAPRSATGEQHPETRSGQTVSFAATGPDFIVRFDSLPKGGLLTALGTAATEISVRVVSGAGTGGDAMVVLPGELRVQNATSSFASYEVRLPGVVTRLRVVVAGRVAFDGVPHTVLRLHP